MRNILFMFLFSVSVLSMAFKCAYSDDNILALDASYNKKNTILADKSVQKAGDGDKALVTKEEPLTGDDSDKELEKMRAYRENLENKQIELDEVKLDLEKASLVLKKKEAEREIYQIDKIIPGGAKEGGVGSSPDAKDSMLDPSDMKLQLLVISDNLKEGQISLKGASYSFKEGDVLPFKLTVEKIGPSGITLREPDGTILKINFMD